MGTNYYAHIPVERPAADVAFRERALAAAATADAAVFALDRELRNGGMAWAIEDTFIERMEVVLLNSGYPPPVDVLHIGKSSAGWTFALHVIPEQRLNDLENWEMLLSEPGVQIFDEYGKEIDLAALLSTIRERGRAGQRLATRQSGYEDWSAFHAANHSEEGPGGLVRSRVDGKRCIKQGAGTWDCHLGDFS